MKLAILVQVIGVDVIVLRKQLNNLVRIRHLLASQRLLWVALLLVITISAS